MNVDGIDKLHAQILDNLPKPKLIGLTGAERAGKDTVARILVENHGFVQINFADTLRAIAEAVDPVVGTVSPYDSSWKPSENSQIAGFYGSIIRYTEAVKIFGYDEAKVRFPELRNFLQKMGTEGGRRILSDTLWVDKWKGKVVDAIVQGKRAVSSDLRFFNERDAVRAWHEDSQIWRICRDGIVPVNTHQSATEYLQIEPDKVLHNTILEELPEKVKDLLTQQGEK